MLVDDPDNLQNLVISRIYAPLQPREKNEFWNRLVEFSSVIDLPWCLMGISMRSCALMI